MRVPVLVLVLVLGAGVLRAGVPGAGVPGAGVPGAGVPGAEVLSAGVRQGLGSVTGTISTSAKSRAPFRVTIDQKVCGQELPDSSVMVDAKGGLANAVVTLAGLKREAPPDAAVVNEKCAFGPRVQIARPKAMVRTSSTDPVLHTTNAQFENGRMLFNVALPMPGLTITKPIGNTGIVRLTCNTHPWMRGWIVATDDAAAVSDAGGRFSIDRVPPGSYELRVWHELLRGAPLKITVAAGPTEVKIELK